MNGELRDNAASGKLGMVLFYTGESRRMMVYTEPGYGSYVNMGGYRVRVVAGESVEWLLV